MDLISIFLIAVALAMDAFSVSITAGMIIPKPEFRHYFRLSFHFGFFQFLLPIVGYFAGAYLENYIKDYDHWVAFALLCAIGTKMLHEAFSDDEGDENEKKDPSKGFRLIYLSVAVSIDALAVGLSLGALGGPVLLAAVIIGVVCSAFSVIGVFIGNKSRVLLGKRAEAIGGIMLILIGIKILVEHIVG